MTANAATAASHPMRLDPRPGRPAPSRARPLIGMTSGHTAICRDGVRPSRCGTATTSNQRRSSQRRSSQRRYRPHGRSRLAVWGVLSLIPGMQKMPGSPRARRVREPKRCAITGRPRRGHPATPMEGQPPPEGQATARRRRQGAPGPARSDRGTPETHNAATTDWSHAWRPSARETARAGARQPAGGGSSLTSPPRSSKRSRRPAKPRRACLRGRSARQQPMPTRAPSLRPRVTARLVHARRAGHESALESAATLAWARSRRPPGA